MEHTFDISVACEYGILEAVIIRNFQYWIGKNKANGVHFVNGHTWTYNSYDALATLFPYATKDQLKKRILRLVDGGVLIIGHFSENTRDRTNWFAFNDEEKWIVPNGTMHSAEWLHPSCKSAPCNSNILCITDNKPNNKPIDEWDEILNEWLEYKKSRKESYKSDKSVQAFVKKLRKLAGDDIATAREIIEQSMANNWAGIFALKDEPKPQQPGRDLIGTNFINRD